MPDYILEPIDTDPDAIMEEMREYIQSFHPDWDPAEAQLDNLIVRFVSLKMATIADMTSRVMRGIYKYFGASIVNIPPLPAASAQVVTEWTAIDTDGPYDIDAGTTFGIRDSLGETHLFTTDELVTIPNGQTVVSNVVATAIDEGVQANSLTGNLEIVEQIDFLQVGVVTTLSSGGVDAESEEEYLDRLTNNLGLMAPRPILAKDFALIARNVVGVWRTAALDNFLPGTNEQQTISHNYTGNGATGGTITWNGQTTAALAWNATAAQVQTALENLNNIEVGDITCTGGPWPAAITLTFIGNLAYTNVAQVTASAGTWTGGTLITITTTVPGVAPNLAADRAVAVAGVDVDGNAISPTLKAELDVYLQSLREQNFIVNVLDPAYTTVDVTYVAVSHPGTDPLDVEARADQAVSEYLSSANQGIPFWPPDARGWERKTTLRIQDLYTILNNVDGLDFVSALTFSKGAGATQDGTDKTFTGIFPLIRPGTLASTVT